MGTAASWGPAWRRVAGLCMSIIQIPMIPGQPEDDESHASFPNCPEDQLCGAGKACKLLLAQPFTWGRNARRRSDLSEPHGVFLNRGPQGSLVASKRVSVLHSWLLCCITVWLSARTGLQLPHLRNEILTNRAYFSGVLQRLHEHMCNI